MADADPSRARKRPRLSHEPDTPPPANADSDNHSVMSNCESISAQSPIVVGVPQEQSTDPSEISINMAGDETPKKGSIAAFPLRLAHHETPEIAVEELAARFQKNDGSFPSPLFDSLC